MPLLQFNNPLKENANDTQDYTSVYESECWESSYFAIRDLTMIINQKEKYPEEILENEMTPAEVFNWRIDTMCEKILPNVKAQKEFVYKLKGIYDANIQQPDLKEKFETGCNDYLNKYQADLDLWIQPLNLSSMLGIP
jgi:hypothetical protein